MKYYSVQYIYDDNGEVVNMIGACYDTRKDAEIVSNKLGGVVMNEEEFETESIKHGFGTLSTIFKV